MALANGDTQFFNVLYRVSPDILLGVEPQHDHIVYNEQKLLAACAGGKYELIRDYVDFGAVECSDSRSKAVDAAAKGRKLTFELQACIKVLVYLTGDNLACRLHSLFAIFGVLTPSRELTCG
jgi:hypothetical protein